MANKRSDFQNRELDTTDRNTPRRNPGDLDPSRRSDDMSFSDTGEETHRDRGTGSRTNERSTEDSYSTSGGKSGTDRGTGSVSGDPMDRSKRDENF